MSEKVFEVVLQQKNGTEAKWNSSSYVPRKSEIIHYTDLNKIKIGDGTKLAKDLPFIGGEGSGEPGKDGVSATHSWNGTVLTITSASGTSSADLKGEKGDTGPSLQSDWLQATETDIDYIKNKPDIKKGSASYSIVEGYKTEATKAGAHAEGYRTHAKGEGSHAEGYSTYATATGSHAEGSSTRATSTGAHAEGLESQASGYCSHAEGESSNAEGDKSHAEGSGAYAWGHYTHAEGSGTHARGAASHVEGRFNVLDKTATGKDKEGTFVHIVGNGENTDNRSNAYALEWNGTGRFAGDVYANCNIDSTGGKKLATEEFVDNKNYKTKQDVVLSPQVIDNYTSEFIDSISQDTNGVILPTKRKVQVAWDNVTNKPPIEKGAGDYSVIIKNDENSNLFLLSNSGNIYAKGKVYVDSENGTFLDENILTTKNYVDSLISSLEEKYSDYIISESSTTTYQSNNTIVWNWYCREWNNGKIEIWATAKATITSDQWEKKSVAYPFYQVKGHLHSSIPQELFPSQSVHTKIHEQATISFTGGYWMPLSLMCRENLNNDPNLSTTTGANTNMYNLSTSFQSTPTSGDNIDICLNIYIVGTYQNETPQA